MVNTLKTGIYSICGANKVESLPDKKSIKSIESQMSGKHEKSKPDQERWYTVGIQVFIPFIIGGIGTIGAGLVLGKVTKYDVFQEVKALFVLVPALTGLKGNLDMCLASRLSTQANLGNMDGKGELFKMIIGNIILVQVQAIVASCLASIFAVSASALVNGDFQWLHALLLATSGVLTATTSCFILDIILVSIIVFSYKFNLNPDNVATPMAASIGDIVSLVILSTLASRFHDINDKYPWVIGAILGIYLCILLPCWIFIVRRNTYTNKILLHGWTPVLSALIISGSGGLVLDSAVDQFSGYELFQPIINGIGGNLVSVQASRISTMLHKTSIKGVIPPHTKQWVAPWTALIKGVLPAKTARLLLIMSVVGQTLFVFTADFINHGESTLTVAFVFSYLTVVVIQLVMLLYIAHLMIHLMWKMKMDPDNSAIPYLTALGDLLGSSLLLLAFIFLKSIHQEYSVKSVDYL